MSKPVRLELNNSGAWKIMARFDADHGDAIVEAAHQLAVAINARESGRSAHTSLRICTDEAIPDVLMRWLPERGEWAAVTSHADQA